MGIRFLLMLMTLCTHVWVQPNDAPEDVAKSFLGKMHEINAAWNLHTIRRTFIELEEKVLTKECADKLLAEIPEGQRDAGQEQSYELKTLEKIANGDGSTFVTTSESISIKGKDNVVKKFRLQLTKADKRWLIGTASESCFYCHGSGSCSTCAGKEAGWICYSCDQTRKCSGCNGSQWLEMKYEQMIPEILLPDDFSTGKIDWSTADACADTYCDIMLQQAEQGSGIARKGVENMLKIMSDHFIAEKVKAIQEAFDRAVSYGKEQARAFKPVARQLSKDDRSALFEVDIPPSRFSFGIKTKTIEMKKIDDKWLIVGIKNELWYH